MDCNSKIDISYEFVDFSIPLLGPCFVYDRASFPHDFLDESSTSNSNYFINSMDKDDYAYLLIFKQLEEGSYMHL